MNTKLNFNQSLLAGLTAAGLAATINAILFFVFKAAGFITDDIFIQDNVTLTIVPILISSIMPTIIASIVFFFIDKKSANGFKVFFIISIILLVLSFISPFKIKDVTMAYAMSLNIMHVVVASTLLFVINKRKQSINS